MGYGSVLREVSHQQEMSNAKAITPPALLPGQAQYPLGNDVTVDLRGATTYGLSP